MLNCRYILHSFLLYETTNFSVFYEVSRLRFRKHFPPDFVRLFRFLVYLFINYFFSWNFYMWILCIFHVRAWFEANFVSDYWPILFRKYAYCFDCSTCYGCAMYEPNFMNENFVSWWFSLTGNNLLKFCEVSVIMLMNIKLYLCA